MNLTNVVWVEQPAGTGFSKKNGSPVATNEIEVAAQFLGFFKNFIDTFSLHHRKIYITGESYAGYYVPYIADAMHNKTDTKYYDIQSIMFYDPSTSSGVLQDDIPTVPFVDANQNLFNLNVTFMADIHERANKCGYTEFIADSMVFPPTGPLATPPHAFSTGKQLRAAGCDIWDDVINAALLFNP